MLFGKTIDRNKAISRKGYSKFPEYTPIRCTREMKATINAIAQRQQVNQSGAIRMLLSLGIAEFQRRASANV